MNKLIVFILFFLCVGSFRSQHTFTNELETDSSWSVNSIYENETGYIFLARYYKNTAISVMGIILFLDKEANILKIIKDSTFQYITYGKMYKINDKNYILGSYQETNISLRKNAFWVYSKDFIFEKFIPIKDSNLLYTDNRLGNPIIYENDFIIGNTGSTNQLPNSDSLSSDAKLMRIDFEGNTIWEKFYSFNQIPYSEDYCGNLIEYNDGYCFSLTSQYINVPYIYHHVIYTDKLGNEIWRKRMDNYIPINVNLPSVNSKIDLRRIINLQNGNILTISHLEHDKYNLGNIDLLFLELDSFGNEINAKIIPFKTNIFLQHIHQIENDEIVFTGFWAENDSSLQSQYIMKIDSQYNLIWMKHFEIPNYNISHSTSVRTFDNGYFLAGTRFRSLPTSGYNIVLVKTDCEGNLEWDNTSCLLPTENEILIFPNPSTDNLIIQCSNFENNIKTEIKIFNDLGQVIFQDYELTNPIFSINTSYLANGIYYCELIQNEKTIKGKFVKI